ncbi:polyhydroxyalkanoate synthesis regulator DNA-binding domain-containing protein [Desulfosarcina sp.]|uniref:polyhydroxyalkanoate synthesis regulator DNA-binding domain-containing protein n=1 Tax=Desulfosarcina sp. TaxID=2027861 RepID=UPI0029AEFE01|nr:polyhydroxyalkanoate synthesis regulator DNA-binding domain-containing protein [Desulfosarcina sp.]MDX2453274.1 polyhydroxyalkanoate synthesis regulator DNA-binding domain-containing protein [Desulfosarcina sp.]MDX2490997.1 polyhydroxyalkanoate synthesis regulator DNA-binding domain-containing protein [Desulfosarcina sp.]
MPDPLVLKKYSNRRLYDTRNSRYVTLEDVSTMIRSGEQLQIQDATTGEDVTAFILTQVVLEAAKHKNSLLPVSVLHLLIRYGDNALGEFFEKYFQKTIQNYLETKKAFDQQFGQWLDMGLDLSRRKPEMMAGTSSMEAMMEMFSFPKPFTPKKADPKHPDPSDSSDSEPKKP